MKNFTLLLALIACFLELKAQELNVPAGKQFSYIRHSKGKGTSSYDIKYTYLFTSLGKDADGNQVFECKLTRAQEKDGRDLSKTILDTDNLYSTDFNHSSVLDKLALIQRPFKMVLSPKGKLLKLDGHEKIMADVSEKWNLDTIYSTKMSRRNEALKSEIQKMFFQFPEGPVNADGGWKGKDGYNYKMKASDNNPPALTKINNEVPGMNNKSTLNNKQKAKRLVEVEYSVNGGMKETGKYILDAETGLIQSSTGHRSFEGDYGSVRWVANDEFTQTISNDLKDPKHDTTWVKMAVSLSLWSDAFKTDKIYDQQKMLSYFEKNDPLYSTDSYYNSHKLRVIQRLPKGPDHDSLYRKTLLGTPNKHLAHDRGDIQISNKMYMLYDTDPVGAHLAAKDAVKFELFDDFLNNSSISQRFLSTYDSSAYHNNYLELLKLMSEDKDPLLSGKSKPLYTWANASIQPKNAKVLLAAANELKALDVAAMKLGNGGRYSLLVYQMLIDAGLKSEAQKLLDQTISKLTITSTDSLNNRKAEDKSILSHAYYLKYSAAQESGDANAIQYLSSAAQNSPINPKDKTRNMFYEKHFLKSKETYREDFLNELFKLKNRPEIIKTMGAHISAEPESLQAMRQLYKKNFPDEDFTNIMFSEVISKWAPAPDFKLKDHFNKQSFTLNDYLGKWMVIDFWGTWCAPCVAEMPETNAFYKELVENKYANAAFLSIACKDYLESVQPFMKKNNYDFPVLMSDGKIQSKYKVDGYPYKVLVSPNGRMIPLQSGRNWQDIIKEFSTMVLVN